MNDKLTAMAVAAALTALAASCSKPDGGSADAGNTVSLDDSCNSAEDADKNVDCKLALGTGGIKGFVAPVGDVDWYSLDVPSPLDKRGLLTVHAQINAPSSPVTLLVNVLKKDGSTSVGIASDKKLRGGPGPVEVVVRLTEPGRYYVVVSHDASADDPAADKKNAYTLTAKLTDDPDEHEPNDVTPTSVSLTACGTARIAGALATAGDHDRYSFDVAPCPGNGRTLLHLLLSAEKESVQQLRLAYTLKGPSGDVAAGFSASPFGQQQLVTVRVVQPGHYELDVSGYKPPGATQDPPGDPNFLYTADLSLFLDADTNEGTGGNDTPMTATAVPLSPGQSKTLTGRISYIPDTDWYAVTVGSLSRPTRLHYKLTWSSAAGRFAPVTTLQPRELNLVTTTNSANDCKVNCPGGNADPAQAWCNRSQCLWSRRVEETNLNFQNFEGQIEVPANSTKPFLFQVDFGGQAGADDRDYTLVIDAKEETADEQSPNDTRQNAMKVTLPSQAVTVPGYGFGRLSTTNAPNGLKLLPRGPEDYDAVSDVDFFEVNFDLPPEPPSDAGTADTGVYSPDLSWGFGWKIPSTTGIAGQRPYDATFRFHFCNDAACTQVSSTGLFGYQSAPGQTWYYGKVPGNAKAGQNEQFFSYDAPTGGFKVTDATCLCIDAKYAVAKRFYVEVHGDNRASYDDAPTTLSMQVGPYDTQVSADGGTYTCPSPCQFVAKSKQ